MEQQQGGLISIVASTCRMIVDCVFVRIRETSTGRLYFHSEWLCGLCFFQNQGCLKRVIWFPQWMLTWLYLCQNQRILHRVIWFPQWLVMWTVFMSESGMPPQGDFISTVDGYIAVSLSESGGAGRFHWTQTIYHREICSATSSQSSRSCI